MVPPLGFEHAISRARSAAMYKSASIRSSPNNIMMSPPMPCCACQRRRRRQYSHRLFLTEEDEEMFLQRELARIESLTEKYLEENDEAWLDDFDSVLPEEDELKEFEKSLFGLQLEPKSISILEEALKQGVVPAEAGVGSGCLAGDFGFDPWRLSEKDYIGRLQRFIWSLVGGGGTSSSSPQARPSALILRDYREAEIRHGRLAMVAAVFWPLQQMLDQFLLDDYGSFLFGSTSLPYFPLLMTLIMLLLGYLDIYSKSIKEYEKVGEAFLPGDCLWDPLSILEGAPDSMKRNMQERELFNGRMAMLAIAVYLWEETVTRQPLIAIEGNELLFEPAYQVPFIQTWLDSQFVSSPTVPFDEATDLMKILDEMLE